MRTEGLGKFKNSPHRVSNRDLPVCKHSALTATLPRAPGWRLNKINNWEGRNGQWTCKELHGVTFQKIVLIKVSTLRKLKLTRTFFWRSRKSGIIHKTFMALLRNNTQCIIYQKAALKITSLYTYCTCNISCTNLHTSWFSLSLFMHIFLYAFSSYILHFFLVYLYS
jgi:hypothetical protein